jgi:hypothetical protein
MNNFKDYDEDDEIEEEQGKKEGVNLDDLDEEENIMDS